MAIKPNLLNYQRGTRFPEDDCLVQICWDLNEHANTDALEEDLEPCYTQ